MKPNVAVVVPLRARREAERKTGQRFDQRFQALRKEILTYNPSFDPEELRESFAWALANPPEGMRRGADNDEMSDPLTAVFSDPINAVRTVAKYARANREIILATPLISSMYPRHGKPINMERLEDIAENPKLGPKVAELVERTLYFMALNLPDNTTSETRKQFRSMALWAAHGPAPIVIRAGQLIDNLEIEARNPGHFNAEMRKRLLTNAKIYADLTEVSGHEDLRKRIMNLALKINHPAEYEEICRIIVKASANKEALKIPERIASLIEEKMGWLEGHHFTIPYREKSAGSAYDKAKRKKAKYFKEREKEIGRPLTFAEKWPALEEAIQEDMSDINAVRVHLEEPAIAEWAVANKATGNTRRAQNRLLRELGIRDNLVYGLISRHMGRGNKIATHQRTLKDGTVEYYSPIQEKLAEIAIRDPRDNDDFRVENPDWAAREKAEDPDTKDARKANYIKHPKPSGYESIHDIGFLFIPGIEQPVRFEFHVVDYLRHKNNTEGPSAGHFQYKIRRKGVVGVAVDNWKRAANAYSSGRRYKGLVGVFVFGPDNKIYDVSAMPTVGEFLKQAGLDWNQVSITDYYERYTKGAAFAPGTPLRNGVRIDAFVPR